MKIAALILQMSVFGLWFSLGCKAQLVANRDNNRDITLKKSILLKDIVLEGLAIGDVNGDGKMDVMADPYWFEYFLGKDPKWIAHQIDEDSGVGLNVVAEDIKLVA